MLTKAVKKLRAWKDQGVRGDATGHLHNLRIRLRRLRYACEFFTEPLGRPMKKAAHCCISLQEIMGRHQDARASAALLCRVAAQLANNPSALLVCGALIQVQRDVEAACRRTFKKAWAKFPQKISRRLRRWRIGVRL
jgi:CHAD domain-containing protein